VASELTSKGAATRARIVEAAADLVAHEGAANMSLDDVGRATQTSRSQLFHYFPGGRTELIRAVAAYQASRTIQDQQPYLSELTSWSAWEAWAQRLAGVAASEAVVGGCRIGSLVAQLGHTDPEARAVVAGAFEQWQGFLADGIRAMQATGEIEPTVEADALALATLAMIQGGLLLTQSTGSLTPFRTAMDQALARLRSFAVPTRPARPRR
jgi:AcrR family transcriptional regulator